MSLKWKRGSWWLLKKRGWSEEQGYLQGQEGLGFVLPIFSCLKVRNLFRSGAWHPLGVAVGWGHPEGGSSSWAQLVPAWRCKCCLVCGACGRMYTLIFIIPFPAFLLAAASGARLPRDLYSTAVCGGDSGETGPALSEAFPSFGYGRRVGLVSLGFYQLFPHSVTGRTGIGWHR